MYGLNNRESKKVDFECDSNCNIVYGVNAVGKSSVADSITHILNNTKYLPRLTDDSKEFSLKIEFDKCKVEYNNSTKDDELSNLNVRDKIYVFNKFYIKNNMSSNTNTGGNIQIGIRIEEKRKKEEQNLKSLKKCSDNFKDLTKNSNYPSAMKNYKEGSLLGTFFKNEPAPYVKKFLESLEKNKMSNDCSIYNENDFYKDTLQQYTKYNIEMGYINEELIEKIKEQKVESLYNINNVKDEKFYEMVISYLENYNDPICPICHN